ncbi:MAG: 50S ribosomal protein L17 [Tannerella sp.]|nr:50S ribosomal protein L17 [Tannerella sp.]
MRHNKKINHLGRTSSHRGAMLSNMASSLIKHKRIFTTTAKAKALRKFVEPLINRTKDDTVHSRRVVFSELQDKVAVKELFSVVSEKVATRPGGYTRILKTGNRLGDNAAMCFIELVDFNENMLKETKKATTKTRRSRKKTTTADAETVAAPVAEKKKTKAKEKAEDAVVVENVEKAAEKTVAEVQDVQEEVQPEVPQDDAAEQPADEEPKA